MPIYDFRCPKCGEKTDVWAGIDEDTKLCACGEVMTRLISPPRIAPDWAPYWEHNMGDKPVYIESRQHYYRELDKRGLHNVNDTRSPKGGRTE